MERTAVRRRLTWQLARVLELVAENARTTSLVLEGTELLPEPTYTHRGERFALGYLPVWLIFV